MRILVIGIKELDKRKFTPCLKTGSDLNKPPFGCCLYGSTLIKFNGGYVSSDWGRFVQLEYYDKDFDYGVSFTLKKSAKIVEIKDVEDYINIMESYSYPGYIRNQIDFYKLSKKYDAFHLTEDAFLKMRTPYPYDKETERICNILKKYKLDDFYYYDAETWILFNLDCIDKSSIILHNNVDYMGTRHEMGAM